MKAKITNEQNNGRNYGGEKETTEIWNVVADVKGRLINTVTARCYMGRSRDAMTVYASVWVHGPNKHTAGHGRAGGGGYDKVSAAIGDAMRSAGIELDTNIDGRGDSATEDALIAVARAAGARGRLLVVRN